MMIGVTVAYPIHHNVVCARGAGAAGEAPQTAFRARPRRFPHCYCFDKTSGEGNLLPRHDLATFFVIGAA